jgi:N4-gp56 family major capsid protein
MQQQPILRFRQFAQHKTELGTQPGNSITMLTFNNLSRGGRLTEGTHMTTKAMGTSTQSVSVYEYGNAIAATEFLLRSSFVDVMANGTLLLANDAAWVHDNEFRKVVYATPNVVYAGSNTSRAGLAVADKFDTAAIRDAVEQLATNKAPKFSGLGRDCYVCVAHPHQLRDLKDDTKWENASLYAGSMQLFQGEIGRFDDVVFVETTMSPYLDASGDTWVDGEEQPDTEDPTGKAFAVYQAAIFGADAYGYAEGLPIELRDNGVTDFGRERALAWYGISGFARLNDNRLFVIESA